MFILNHTVSQSDAAESMLNGVQQVVVSRTVAGQVLTIPGVVLYTDYLEVQARINCTWQIFSCITVNTEKLS